MPSVPEGQIFKATYSGVPVYECIIKDVAVMRRRSDAWLNATQLLKVVGLDKSQRTRVLEKEVQKGIHEKVQGGYGKYQGTWIPMDVAIALAEHYHIRELLEPILSFVPSDRSPPPAPKHAVASSSRIKKLTADHLDAARARASSDDSSALGADDAPHSEGSMSPSPSDLSSSSRTPSPIVPDTGSAEAYGASSYHGGARHAGAMHTPGGRMAPPYAPYRDAYGASMMQAPVYDEMEMQARYAETILDYFISETTTIPPLLVNPPSDFDPNMSIDEDEHTALHWACAMGRVRVVKLLLTAGADVFRVNSNGQTALMRAAMFSNNYDLRKFPELFELLHRSILNIDRNDRTVFHHVVDLALSRGKPHASRYYLETMVHRLVEYGEQLADILNFQDDEGETALTMAARARSKRLVKLLLEHGADPKIRNREGKNAEDYIVEDERFRASPARATGSGARAAPGHAPHSSEAGQRAAGRSVGLVSTLLHDLADSYDTELSVLEKKLVHAQSLLVQIQGEMAESHRLETRQSTDQSDRTDEAELHALEQKYEAALFHRAAVAADQDWRATRDEIQRALPDGPLGEAPALPDKLQALCAVSSSPREELQALLDQAQALARRYAQLVHDHVVATRDEGTNRTMTMYRRLIAAGCGGISTDEVDAVVGVLSDLLEEGQPGAVPKLPESDMPAAPSPPGALDGASAAVPTTPPVQHAMPAPAPITPAPMS